MPRAALILATGLLALAAKTAAASPEEARQWLERMSTALAERNYDGLFTHTTGGQTETMRIVHRVEKGYSVERLVSLDGSGREIIRTREEVHCYLPDRRVVLVEPRTDDGSLLKALPAAGDDFDTVYQLDVRKGHKVLGRDVRVIDVRPRDSYRYGYRLWLDEQTAMPLRSIVGDLDGRVVEQILFTRLEVKDKIDPKDTEPAVDATGFQWLRTSRRLAARPPALPGAGWRALRVPPGFRLVGSRIQTLPGSPMPAQHLIFSDGFAVISVFIEPGKGTGPTPPESSSIGSASAFSTSVQGHMITAVGEVPPATVRDIATSVVPISDDGAQQPGQALAPAGP